jgi:hypothetical protein
MPFVPAHARSQCGQEARYPIPCCTARTCSASASVRRPTTAPAPPTAAADGDDDDDAPACVRSAAAGAGAGAIGPTAACSRWAPTGTDANDAAKTPSEPRTGATSAYRHAVRVYLRIGVRWCGCGWGEPNLGAEVAGVSPVPVRMWRG